MKRFLTTLCLTVLLVLVLAVPALAAESDHAHCLCVDGKLEEGCDHTSLVFTEVTDETSFREAFNEAGDTVSICLANSFTIQGTWTVTDKTVNICLNGKTLTVEGSLCAKNGTLNITSCKEGGTILDNTASTSQVLSAGFYDSSDKTYTAGVINMYNGHVNASAVNISGTSDSNAGGAVRVETDASTFTMYGGRITGATLVPRGAGVYVQKGNFTMHGGIITGGTATTYGGGVGVNYGTMNMTGGIITGCHAKDSANGGGGVNIGYNATEFVLSGDARIYGNFLNGAPDDVRIGNGAKITGKKYYLALDQWEGNGTDAEGNQRLLYLTHNVLTAGTKVVGFESDVADPMLVKSYFALNGGDQMAATTAGITRQSANAHVHCACNGKSVGVGDHICEDVVYASVSTATDLTTALTNGGAVCLADAITLELTSDIAVSGAVDICLNGQALTLSGSGKLNVTGSLNISDCAETCGTIVTSSKSQLYVNGGSIALYNGHINAAAVNDSTEADTNAGGAVRLENKNGLSSFTMYGGQITGATLTYRGGAVYSNYGTITIHGGLITGGHAMQYGGGIGANRGVVVIDGGEITGCTTAGTGGGVNIGHNATSFTLSGDAKIYGNTAGTVDNDVNIGNGKTPANCYLTLGQWEGNGVDENGNQRLLHMTNAKAADNFKVVGYATGVTNPAAMKRFFAVNGWQLYATAADMKLKATTAHIHCACNGKSVGVGGHICEDAIFTEVTTADAFTAAFNASGAQNISLGGNITLTAEHALTTARTVNVCLHGHTISMDGNGRLTANKSGVLNITDCTENADQAGSVKALSGCKERFVYTYSGGTLQLFGGKIDGSAITAGKETGTTVYVTSGASGPYCTFNMYGGKIIGAATTYGGSVSITSGNTFKMYGGVITDGVATASSTDAGGGNICVASGAFFEMHGGTIQNGQCAQRFGGNVCVLGTMTMTGGTITGGEADCGGNVTVSKPGNFAMSGGLITNGLSTSTGGIYGNGVFVRGTAASFALSGDARIYGNRTTEGNKSDVSIPRNPATSGGTDYCVIALGGWNGNGVNENGQANPKLIIDRSGQTGIFANISNGCTPKTAAYFQPKNSGYGIVYNADAKTVSLDTAANTKKGTALVYNDGARLISYTTLSDAVAVAQGTDMVVQLNDEANDVTANGKLYLDLNGNNVTGKVTVTDGKLYLIDRATADYAVAEDGLSGFGKILGGIDAQYDRTFNTPKATYGNNWKYLVLEDADGAVHAHRIYLSVKTIWLYPRNASLRYESVFYCDETVAARVSDYGILMEYEGNQESATLGKVDPYSTGINSRVTALYNIVKEELDDATNEARASKQANAYAYITLDGEETPVLKSTVRTKGLKDVCTEIFNWTKEQAAGMTNKQSQLLLQMHDTYKDLMHPWCSESSSLLHHVIENRVHCVCNGLYAGHDAHTSCNEAYFYSVSTADDFYSYFDSKKTLKEDANLHLEGDITITGEYKTGEHTLNLCLNGHTLTIADGGRLTANEGGTLSITEHNGGNGKILAKNDKNNLYVYGGTLNLYNGVVDASTAAAGSQGAAVAVYSAGSTSASTRGTFNMFGGTVTGGKTVENGGNILVQRSDFNLYGGIIEGGQANEAEHGGGNIYLTTGSVMKMYGGTIRDGQATASNTLGGSNVCVGYLATFEMYGGEITNEKVSDYAFGGVCVRDNATKFAMSGDSKICGHGLDVYIQGSKPITMGAWNGNGDNKAQLVVDAADGVTQVAVFDNVSTDDAKNAILSSAKAYRNGDQLYLTADKAGIELSRAHRHCVCSGAGKDLGSHTACTDTLYDIRVSSLEEWNAAFGGDNALDGDTGIYLDANITLTSEYSTAGHTLNLCLNGYKITMDDGRLTANGNGTLNISDCTGNGSIVTTKALASTPGLLYTNGGHINMYGGQVSGYWCSGGEGYGYGTVLVGAEGDSFSIYGGTLTGKGSTRAASGAAISCEVVAAVNVYGGTITSGKASGSGGNISMAGGGDLTITGGTITKGDSTGSGGNICITGGSNLTITGGTIEGGFAKTNGGNILMTGDGIVTITGGEITNGEAAKLGGNINMHQGQLSISGGTITGGIAGGDTVGVGGGGICMEYGATLFSLSGNAKIYGNTGISADVATGGADIRFSSGERHFLTLDNWAGNGELGQLALFKNLNADFPKYNVIRTADGITAPNIAFFQPWSTDYKFLQTGANEYSIVPNDAHVHDCSCNGALEGTEGHTCYPIIFEAVSTTEAFTGADYFKADEPSSEAEAENFEVKYRLIDDRNVYLAGDIELAAEYAVQGHTLNICLCGHTITMRDNGRITSNANGELNITDCTEDGTIQAVNGCRSGFLYTYNGAMNLYSGIIDATGVSEDGQAAIYISNPGGTDRFTMYGGSILGKNGNAVAANNLIQNRGKFTLNGGTIVAGNTDALTGAAVYNYGGEFVMNGGTIDASAVVTSNTGGAVFSRPLGTLDENGNIVKPGSFTMNGGKIIGGTADRGGAVTVSGNTFTMNGGEITGGTSTSHGGNVSVQRLNYTRKVTYADGTEAEESLSQDAVFIMNGGKITGGTAALGGGNLFLTGSSATITKGNITGGSSQAQTLTYAMGEAGAYSEYITALAECFGGGNICVGYESNLTVSGGTINNGTCAMGRGDISVQSTSFDTVLSGSPTIGTLYLCGKSVIINKALTGGSVGVSLQEGAGKFASGAGAVASKAYFTSTQGDIAADTDSLYISGTAYSVGYGEADITPTRAQVDTGLNISGYGKDVTKTSASSVITPLYATAIAVTDAQGDTVLVISADACSISNGIATAIRRNISRATGIPVDNIALSAIHQHSTPGIGTVKYTQEEYDAAIDAGETPPYAVDEVITDYGFIFYKGVFNAALEAYENRSPVTKLETSTVETKGKGADGKSFNYVRNISIKDKAGTIIGTVSDNHIDVKSGTYTGSNPTYTAEYESNVDHTMQLVRYTLKNGRKVIMANFQTHPHLGANKGESVDVHPDLVGAFRDTLKDSTTDVIYISGAGGNVNARDSHLTGSSYAKAEYLSHGQDLAGLAKSAKYTAIAVDQAWDVDVRTADLEYGLQDLYAGKTANQIANLLARAEYIALDPENNHVWEDEVGSQEMGMRIYSRYHANSLISRYNTIYNQGVTTENISISAYSLGPVGMVIAPYEMFQENGQTIKGISVAANGTVTQKAKAGDFSMIFVASKANGSEGYIPSAAGYTNGGYSTDVAHFAAGTGEALVNKYLELLTDLRK